MTGNRDHIAAESQWLRIADREHGRGDAPVPVLAAAGDLEAENRELRRRTKQLEQENEIRATVYFARDALPQ